MLLSISNTKLGMNLIRTASFGLEAVKTCPSAGECKKACFALAGNYVFPNVKAKQAERLAASKQSDFVDVISNELKALRVGAVRIHDSGDFYNKFYLNKWIKIATLTPTVIFYAYTKSVNLFKSDFNTWKVSLPSNFVITFSFGGVYDSLINRVTDKHALVFSSLDELLSQGYDDTSRYDDNAYNPKIKNVGLVAKTYRKKDAWQAVKENVLNAQV